MKKLIIFTVAVVLSGTMFASGLENSKSFSELISLDTQAINSFETEMPRAEPVMATKNSKSVKLKEYIEQDYVCPARYDTEKEAEQAMLLAKTNLEKAGAILVMPMVLKVDGFTKYSFTISFASTQKLTYYTALASIYGTYEEAGKGMGFYAGLLETHENHVISAEVISEPLRKGYTYHIAYFSSAINKSGNKFIKVCLLNGIKDDNCVYKCTGGSTYTRPMERPFPGFDYDTPFIVCPLIVFPF